MAKRREFISTAAALMASSVLPLPVAAQTYPARPIKYICPWPAGGSTDVVMRSLAESAGRHLGQAIIVENRPGAGGTLGALDLVNAKPDGYTVAQLLMSEADGRPFAELMQRRVLGPLGMAESSFAQPLPTPLLTRAAAGVLPDGRAVLGKRHSYPELAAAGLWTTSQDLARFALGVQAAWRGDKTALLSTPMVKDMLSQRAGSGYGLGFGLPEEEGEVYFAHGGWNEGFCASLMAHPSAGVGMAIMINANQPALMDELRRAVAFEYRWPGFKAHQPLPARKPWTRRPAATASTLSSSSRSRARASSSSWLVAATRRASWCRWLAGAICNASRTRRAASPRTPRAAGS